MFTTLIRPAIFEQEKNIRCGHGDCECNSVYICYLLEIDNLIAYCEKHGNAAIMHQIDKINDRIEKGEFN